MKPPVLDYHAPADVPEALALLTEHGTDAKVLAGGQSLVPLLNFRLSRPAHLVDVNGLGELARVTGSGGRLRIGALTRQSTLERSHAVATGWPLLREAVRCVAHPQIRNRGTVGGSIAHADPAAELPVALAALDGSIHARSRRGTRTLPWHELFVTHLTTSLEPDELIVEIELPPPPPRTGSAFVEHARRHGDFALGGAAVLIALADDGGCRQAAIALLGAASTPIRATAAEQALAGQRIDADVGREIAATAVASIEPTGDLHGSSEFRRGLIGVLVERAIAVAAKRAEGEPR